MLARIRKMQEREEGFTLIELLVVMIIIGILAAIAIPVFLSQKKKGYEASEKSDVRSLVTEITTQAVDSPTSIAIAQVTGAVTVTPTTGTTVGTASKISTSPGNLLVAGSAVNLNPTVAGQTAFCVGIKNPKAGQAWEMLSNNANNYSPTLTAVALTTACTAQS